MLYLIQDNIFKLRHQQMLLDALERMGLDYELVNPTPFDNELTVQTTRKDVFVFGAIKMAELTSTLGFAPGTMLNSNHDFEIYAPQYGSRMLNYGAHIMNLADPLPENERWTMFFARPCKDNKAFTGQVFMRHSWEQYVAEVIKAEPLKEQALILSPIHNASPGAMRDPGSAS